MVTQLENVQVQKWKLVWKVNIASISAAEQVGYKLGFMGSYRIHLGGQYLERCTFLKAPFSSIDP